MSEEEKKVGFQIRHPYNGASHYGPRGNTKCHGISVELTNDGKILTFYGLHTKGVGKSIAVKLDANQIDKLIAELTEMREEIIIANL